MDHHEDLDARVPKAVATAWSAHVLHVQPVLIWVWHMHHGMMISIISGIYHCIRECKDMKHLARALALMCARNADSSACRPWQHWHDPS